MIEATWGLAIAVLGIAIAVFLPGMGSSKGTGIVGQAGAGLTSEDPEKFGKVLILVALPGTQAVYGLLVGFLLMMNLGFLGTPKVVSLEHGLAVFFAALPIAVVGYLSAIAQGQVAAAGVGVVAKKPDEVGKAIILAAMVETFAILGLLASILLVNGLGAVA